jgi:amino acid transporter
MAAAIVVILITYCVPVMIGLGVQPDPRDWADCDFVCISGKVSRTLRAVVLVGAVACFVSLYTAMLAAGARVVQGAAAYGMLPRFLRANWTRRRTPIPALLLVGATSSVLMQFHFSELVVLDTSLNNVSLVLEAIAFLRVKHTCPDLPRAYTVPGGLAGAWIASGMKIVVQGVYFYGLGWTFHTIAWIAANAVFVSVGYAWARRQERRTRRERSDGSDAPLLVDGVAASPRAHDAGTGVADAPTQAPPAPGRGEDDGDESPSEDGFVDPLVAWAARKRAAGAGAP